MGARVNRNKANLITCFTDANGSLFVVSKTHAFHTLPDYTQYRREEIVQLLLKHACKSSHCMDKLLSVFGKTIGIEGISWKMQFFLYNYACIIII